MAGPYGANGSDGTPSAGDAPRDPFYFLDKPGISGPQHVRGPSTLPWLKILSFLETLEAQPDVDALIETLLSGLGSLVDFELGMCTATGMRPIEHHEYDPRQHFHYIRAPASMLRDYFGHFMQTDPVLPIVPTIAMAHIDWPRYDSSEFAMDFLRRYGLRFTIGLSNLNQGKGEGFVLGIHRGGPRPFTDRDRAIMAILYPHFHALFSSRMAPERTRSERIRQRGAAAGLTEREQEVLGLLADRLGAAEISERLFISPRTVEKHVERIYQKLGSSSRRSLLRELER